MNLVLALFFVVLSSTAFAEEVSPFVQQFPRKFVDKCLEKTSLKLSDVNGFIEPEEVEEKLLCWIKCVNENLGTISEDGSLNLKLIAEQPGFKALGEKQRKTLMDCLGKHDELLKTCVDVKPIRKCYRDVLSL